MGSNNSYTGQFAVMQNIRYFVLLNATTQKNELMWYIFTTQQPVTYATSILGICNSYKIY